MSSDLFAEVFRVLPVEQQELAADAINRLSSGIADLIPLMHGDDDGGAVRVGYVLVGIGKRLAGVS
jgi:hypothetical protein